MSSVNIGVLPDLQAFRTAANAATDGYVKLGGETGVKSAGGGFFGKMLGIGKPNGAESRRVREALFSAMSASTGDNMLLKLTIENVRNQLGLGPASDPKIGNKPLSQRELKQILTDFDGAKAGTEAVMRKSTYGDVMAQMRPELRKVYAGQYAYGANECRSFEAKVDKCLNSSGGVPTDEAAEIVLDEFRDWTNLIPGRLTASDLSKECRANLQNFEDQMRQRVENLRSELKAGTKSPCEVLENLIDAFAAQKAKLAEVKEDLVKNGHREQADAVRSDANGTLDADFTLFLQTSEMMRNVWRGKTAVQMFDATISKLPTTNENKAIIRLGIEKSFMKADRTLAQAKETFDSNFWAQMSRSITILNANLPKIANEISKQLEKVLPSGIAKAMTGQLYDQILKYGLFSAAYDIKDLANYVAQCANELANLDAKLVQSLCPMFNMQEKEGVNIYLKNELQSKFREKYDAETESTDSSTASSTKNKVNHLTIREYHGTGTVKFDGKIAESDTATVRVPKGISHYEPYRRNFYKFMSGKFDDNHSGVSRLLTFCLGMSNGICGVTQELFRKDVSPGSSKLRKGQELPLVMLTADLHSTWDDGNPSTYEITTDRKNGEIVLVANVNLALIPLLLPGRMTVGTKDSPFLRGLLKNTAQVRIRIKNTDDATLKKENKIHPDFEVEILPQKIADLNGKELYVNQ